MSVTVTLTQQLTVAETLTTGVPGALAAKAVITHDQFNITSKVLNSGSSPAASQASVEVATLSSGALTLDLTALPATNGATHDNTGLKVCAAWFGNPAANANPITVTFGASNGYLLLGSAWKFILKPGDSIGPIFVTGAPTIGSSAKNIDLAGTGAQTLNYSIVTG